MSSIKAKLLALSQIKEAIFISRLFNNITPKQALNY